MPNPVHLSRARTVGIDGLRVCMITGGHWAAVMGGAQYQVKCLIEALCEEPGIEVSHLARDVNASYRPKGYRLVQIARPTRLSRRSFLFDAVALTRRLQELRPDVLYQRGLQPYTGIAARYAIRNGRKFVFHIAHDFDVARASWDAQEWRAPLKGVEMIVARYGLRRASHVIAQTRKQASLLELNFGKKASAVLPNFHPDGEEDLNKPDGPITVVWAANFKPFKRPELFVDLARDLAHRTDVQFVMLGRPGDRRRYGDLLKRIAALPNLKYRGEQPLAVVNQVLAGAHVFVNTSVAEGFPNTFIQAWMRRAVVASLDVDVDGILSTGKVGFLAGSYDALKATIVRLVDDEELRNSTADRGRQHALKHHSTANAQILIDLLKR